MCLQLCTYTKVQVLEHIITQNTSMCNEIEKYQKISNYTTFWS